MSLQVSVKKHVMKAALKKGVETGTLVPVKASYKLSAESKKKAPKKKSAPKKKAKAAPKKKTAPKKKVSQQTIGTGKIPLSSSLLTFV
jgi:histone H1/5